MRAGRFRLPAERLDEDLSADAGGNETFEHQRVRGRDAQHRRLTRTPTRYEPELAAGKVIVTDLDSGRLTTRIDFVLGGNGQAALTRGIGRIAAQRARRRRALTSPSRPDPVLRATSRSRDPGG
jgi:hypothetical protein